MSSDECLSLVAQLGREKVGRKLHAGGGLLSCEMGPDGALIFDIAKGAVARHLLRIFHTI
jgi:hypothetical protein